MLDVQTDGRLVRIEQHQGEYWVLMLMLAGLKTQWSACVLRSHEAWKYGDGFFAEQLHLVLERLPPHLSSDKRRKRSYVNQVLSVCVRRTHIDECDEAQVEIVVGVQRCGSKSSMRLAGWIGRRSRMSFR